MRGMYIIVFMMIFQKSTCSAAHHQRSHAVDMPLDIAQIIITNEHDLNRVVLNRMLCYRLDPPVAVIRHSNSRLHKGVFYCCLCLFMSGIGVVIWRFS